MKPIPWHQRLIVTRRGVQIALGCLWLLDGLLQLQPRMFTHLFADSVIASAAQGQPGIIAVPMQFFMGLFLWQPVLANLGIAFIQVGLGILILWKRSARIGLLLSVGWGVFVWIIGEGLSGLASGHALMLAGSPGAAVVYALLALAVIPKQKPATKSPDRRPAAWLIFAWMAIWLVGATYQVLPGQNSVADVSSMILSNANGAPTWLATVDTDTARWLSKFGDASVEPNSMAGMPGMGASQPQNTVTKGPGASTGFSFLLMIALLQVLIAVAVIIPGFVRVAAVLIGSLLSLIFWVVGQSLGNYYSGLATDPNTGPLLVLLGVAVIGCTQLNDRVIGLIKKTKTNFVAEIKAFNES